MVKLIPNEDQKNVASTTKETQKGGGTVLSQSPKIGSRQLRFNGFTEIQMKNVGGGRQGCSHLALNILIHYFPLFGGAFTSSPPPLQRVR